MREVFGYPQFRAPQGEIIDHVARGGDALVLMPTGGGKSLCYQIPALVRPGLAVVVSPLIALMQDQVAGLKEAGVRAEALNSALHWEDAQRIERLVRSGDLDLLYLAPERLLLPDDLSVEILQLVDGTNTVDDIVDALMVKFSAQREEILTDVTALLQDLTDKGTLVG